MLIKIFFEADGTGGGGAADQDPKPGEGGNEDPPEQTFEEWLENQDDKVKELYESNVSGLKTALQSERDAKKDLSAQLKELLPKAEKGSELEKQLTEMANKADAAERRAQFAEEAIKPEIGCRNIKAAYALAVADDLFDKRGNPDWDEIKKIAPELFGKKGRTDASEGEDTPPADINAAIRKAAGR